MKENTIEEYQERLRKLQARNKELLDEVDVKNKTIKLLLVAGYLDEDKLEQATALAGGIK